MFVYGNVIFNSLKSHLSGVNSSFEVIIFLTPSKVFYVTHGKNCGLFAFHLGMKEDVATVAGSEDMELLSFRSPVGMGVGHLTSFLSSI